MKENVNILEHTLVPKHIILTSEEKEEVIKKYGITKQTHFPKIFHSDPVAKAIGAKPGDLIKIIRKSHTAGETVYYRIVVEDWNGRI